MIVFLLSRIALYKYVMLCYVWPLLSFYNIIRYDKPHMYDMNVLIVYLP